MNKKIIIACTKNWFLKNSEVKKFLKKKNIFLITQRRNLNINFIKKINPNIIFFPHWSYKVDEDILNKYKCICFHTAPLPYGRGGSPIQNLIIKNFKKSPICAIKMTKDLDAGPIYIKKIINLRGTLNEIFERMSIIIFEMIKILMVKKIYPKKQRGKVFKFIRLKENNSEIKDEINIQKIYDKIRMLDSDCYPNAYIKINNFKFLFSKPILKKNSIICNAKILKIKK